jgi:NADPH:quinone reductase-like Zn-dependent oxidoreductase
MPDTVEILRSAVIDAPVEAVWRLLRDFNGHAAWHPAIATSRIEAGDPADMVGAIRAFRLADGSFLREQLVALSDLKRQLTYSLLEAPLPLIDYVATVRLRPVTDADATLVTWQSRFRPPASQAAALARLVAEDIYDAGFRALRAHFEALPRRSPSPLAGEGRGGGKDGNLLASPVLRPQSASAPPPVAAIDARAIVVERYGGPETMVVRTTQAPPPAAGEARIRHAAIGVNFIDIYCRTGFFNLLRPPGVPGMEAAGTVLDVGEGVTHLRAGDRVVYACEPVGAYAEARTMPAALLVPLPSNIDEETAAAIFLKGVSAEFLLHAVHPVRAGETILVHAAAGGMGLLLTQWATALGARVIGTASTEEKARRARAAGCAEVIPYSGGEFASETRALTAGRGIDVVYDGIGAATFAGSLDALAARGHLVSFGQASGPIGAYDIGDMAGKSITVSRPNFSHYTSDPNELRARAERLFEALRRGVVAATIDRRLPLADAAAAHRRLENRDNIGAIILIP